MCQRWDRLIRSLVLVVVLVCGVDVSIAQDSFLDNVARALLGGVSFKPRPLTDDDAPIQVARDQLVTGITNAYDPSGVRYLAVRLRIQNRTAKELVVDSNASRISIGMDVAQRVTTAEQLGGMPVSLVGEDPDGVDPIQIQGPDQFKVAPGKGHIAWMIFAPLPLSRDLPEMQLHLETSAGPINIDLTRREQNRLKVESERIGPGGCVQIARISGDLNVLNLPDLVSQLRPTHPSALVLSFQRGAILRDPLIEEWLIDGREDADNERLKYLPPWPGLSQTAVIVGLPGQSDETGDAQAATESQAIRMVSRQLIPQLDSATLRQELRSGHLDFRRAILQDHGDLVAQVEPSALLTALNDKATDGDLRLSLIQSMRSVTSPEAANLLESMIHQGTREEATQALRSLNLSPLPTARTRAIELARDPQVRKRIGLPMILRSVGVEVDAAWLPVLQSAFEDSDPLARDLALQQMLSLGIPDRLQILEKAFADPSDDVRETAYQAIVGHRFDEEYPLFVRETDRRFRAGLRDENTLTGIGEIRDPKHIPELLKSIDESEGEISSLVECCLSLGGNEVFPELEQRFKRLPTQTQLQVLRSMYERDDPAVRRIAISQVSSPDDELRELSVSVVVSIGDDECHAALRQHLLKHADDTMGEEAARVVGQSGTPQSKRFLRALSLEKSPELRRMAEVGLSVELAAHPNFNWREIAQDFTREGQFEGAIEALKLAIETDDQDWLSANSLGFAYLQQSRHADAVLWFKLARELNPDYHLSLTGIAICQAVEGRTDDAINMVDRKDMLIRWGQEQVFLYNVACVYGRSIEHLTKQPGRPDLDLRLRVMEDRAISLLEKSIDCGFGDLRLLDTDPDLNSLRKLPKFALLSKRMQERDL